MRVVLVASLVWLGTAAAAAAQYQHSSAAQSHSNQNQNRTPNGSGQRGNGQNAHGQHGADTPAPPPIPRCADLAVTSLGFADAIPGAPPLTGNEIALQYDVHNAGTSMYVAPSGASQSLSLEYTTPGGTHEVGTMALPAPASSVSAATAQGVTLAQGQSWRGYMRIALPPEARRWPLRLRLNFTNSSSPYAARISDCDPGNDQAPVPRP